MTKGKVLIEIDRAGEGCRWIWDVWFDGKFYKSGVEDTAKAAMDAVLDVCDFYLCGKFVLKCELTDDELEILDAMPALKYLAMKAGLI